MTVFLGTYSTSCLILKIGLELFSFNQGGYMQEEEKFKKALMKKALGYDAMEVVKEFSFDPDGNEKLSKKKVTKKHYTPDLNALKMLIEKFYPSFDMDVSKMTDEELILEKEKILQLLKEEVNGN